MRQYASSRPSNNWLPSDSGGYFGSFVCAACRKPVKGVYHTPEGWNCGGCRSNAQFFPRTAFAVAST